MGLSNVRFEFLFFAGMGKSPETRIITLVSHHQRLTNCQVCYETGVRARRKEPKAYPTIFTNLYTTLTGDCLSPTHSPDMATEAP